MLNQGTPGTVKLLVHLSCVQRMLLTLLLIFACLSNLLESDTLPSVSNCKFSLSDNIEVAKKTSNQTSPFKSFKSFKKKYRENFRNYD